MNVKALSQAPYRRPGIRDLPVRASRRGAEVTEAIPRLEHEQGRVDRVVLEDIDRERWIGWPAWHFEPAAAAISAADLKEIFLYLEVPAIGHFSTIAAGLWRAPRFVAMVRSAVGSAPAR